jgi:hypothetical protein
MTNQKLTVSASFSRLAQQFRQLGEVHRHAPRGRYVTGG